MCEAHSHGPSEAFHDFLTHAPHHSEAWNEAAHRLTRACALDEKTAELATIAVLSALGLERGVPFHVERAKDAGATREEVVSAVLLGLPEAGNRVIQSLPAALAAYEPEPVPVG